MWLLNTKCQTRQVVVVKFIESSEARSSRIRNYSLEVEDSKQEVGNNESGVEVKGLV